MPGRVFFMPEEQDGGVRRRGAIDLALFNERHWFGT